MLRPLRVMISRMLEGHRRSIRLPDYDYAQPGLYFVTICSHERKSVFGTVVDKRMELNGLGRIVHECWLEIPYHFAPVELDAFVVMPNHLHGIILLHPGLRQASNADRAQHAAPLRNTATEALRAKKVAPRSLAAVIRSFKAAVRRRAGASDAWGDRPVWQRNYYEHIIRNGDDLAAIQRYIRENPSRWEEDTDNPDAKPNF